MVERAGEVIPILRIFSVEKAREFYVDYLDFHVDWFWDTDQLSLLDPFGNKIRLCAPKPADPGAE